MKTIKSGVQKEICSELLCLTWCPRWNRVRGLRREILTECASRTSFSSTKGAKKRHVFNMNATVFKFSQSRSWHTSAWQLFKQTNKQASNQKQNETLMCTRTRTYGTVSVTTLRTQRQCNASYVLSRYHRQPHLLPSAAVKCQLSQDSLLL